MRIVVHDYAGHPFQVQLSRELAQRGHEVLHLYFGLNNTPKGDLHIRNSDPESLKIDGILLKNRSKNIPSENDGFKIWNMEICSLLGSVIFLPM